MIKTPGQSKVGAGHVTSVVGWAAHSVRCVSCLTGPRSGGQGAGRSWEAWCGDGCRSRSLDPGRPTRSRSSARRSSASPGRRSWRRPGRSPRCRSRRPRSSGSYRWWRARGRSCIRGLKCDDISYYGHPHWGAMMTLESVVVTVMSPVGVTWWCTHPRCCVVTAVWWCSPPRTPPRWPPGSWCCRAHSC